MISVDFIPPLPPEEPESVCLSPELRPRKKTRWGDINKRVNILPVPSSLTRNFNTYRIEEFLVDRRLEEIDRKIRSGSVLPEHKERSPSPSPRYDSQGKRTNMREARYRKKLEDEKSRLIKLKMKISPIFRPPPDFRKMIPTTEKVWIPAKEYPQINFIGLLIGPRGNELKRLESESGTKISIRGKGSIKEGKSRNEQSAIQGADEELHAFISGDSEEKVHHAIKLINIIIENAITIPECENKMKMKQLKELASLNGTLRREDREVCSNCYAVGHRKFDCPEKVNITISLICKVCGGVGHLSKDCMHKNNPEILKLNKMRQDKMSEEYMAFMSEISGNHVNHSIDQQRDSAQLYPQQYPNIMDNLQDMAFGVQPPLPD